jgi:DNA processing protein
MVSLLQLAVSLLPGLTCNARVLLSSRRCGTGDTFQRKAAEAVRRSRSRAAVDVGRIIGEAERIARWLEDHAAWAVTYDEPDYPSPLREIFDPPYLLYVRGTLPPRKAAAFAVVGTRRPQPACEQAAFRLGFEAASAGIPVVSGLAVGIDFAVHSGAAAVGDPVAAWGVLGSGIGAVYPRSSLKLAERIAEGGGGLLSEYPPLAPPQKYHFPARNRIISGMCRAVCVVEAPQRSGSLITADFALEQGRDVYVHTEGLRTDDSQGSKRLAEEGAPALSSMTGVCLDWGLDPSAVPELLSCQDEGGARCRIRRSASGTREGECCRFKGVRYTLAHHLRHGGASAACRPDTP